MKCIRAIGTMENDLHLHEMHKGHRDNGTSFIVMTLMTRAIGTMENDFHIHDIHDKGSRHDLQYTEMASSNEKASGNGEPPRHLRRSKMLTTMSDLM